jgi:glycine cleavage system H protein
MTGFRVKSCHGKKINLELIYSKDEQKMKYYSEAHEWIKVEDDEAIIGISEYAAEELGDITYVELPIEDDDVVVGDTLGVIESVKAASDVYSPIGGTITEVNADLEENPGLVNESAEENGWMCKLKNIDVSELDGLMTPDAYVKYLKSLA